MISIEKYSEKRKTEIDLLGVRPEQAAFTVSQISDFIASLQEHEHPHLIIDNGQVVGFFLLDLLYTETYGFSDSKALGIRALLVGHHYQGQGGAGYRNSGNQLITCLRGSILSRF
ncbi:hypothetical protein VR7878_01597 [Vibrio ruber DSM 16370]|uniref:N-acetyltransferase domain-containing protein n=1 Tax=Vibrio ruber (strain DSM 16370 / JCM 11486 / BCRC 17186 / CECT 7878 / LMG 23124 / VR1) TaxID=1123498 RepID=A0A1R4LIE3_VIBR1|nr:hypothetical protein VR7878_01597 [Vibrio ruber DSM 16370]